jgi:hypothetical protein
MADKIEGQVDTGTYDGMIGMLKWGSLGVAVLVAIVIWLIAG